MSKLRVASPGVFLTLVAGVAAAQQPVFESALTPLATQARRIAVGDFDSDGRPDVVASEETAGQLQLCLGRGDGSFAVGAPVSTTPNGYRMLAEDLDGDGDLDVAVGGDALTVLAGDGQGGLEFLGTAHGAGAAYPLAAGDFDGDGTLDLISTDNPEQLRLLGNDGHGNFTPETLVATGLNDAAIGDFDGDGDLDLGASDYSASMIRRYAGDGRGGFAAPTSLGFSKQLDAPVVADLDGNGLPDLAAVSGSVVVVLRSQPGAAAWDYGPTYPVGTIGGSDLLVGDLLEDSQPDLIVLGIEWLAMFPGNGLGGFGPVQVGGPVIVDAGPFGVDAQAALLDANGDGHLDVAVASPNGTGLSIALGHGQGLPSVNQKLQFLGVHRGVAACDVDGDSLMDLAIATVSPDELDILRGTGGGKFAAPVSFPAAAGVRGIDKADFDLDGDADLALSCVGADGVQLMLNDGTGSFVAHGPYATGADPVAVVALDLNLDGEPDVASADSGGQRVSVLLGNGTGALGPALQVSLPSAPSALRAGDVDLDGVPDLLLNLGTMHLLRGLGDGSFTASTVIPGTPRDLGDFNGDGDLDIASIGPPGLSTYPGLGGTSFGAAIVSDVGLLGLAGTTVADFDLDGHLDLAADGGLFLLPIAWLLHGTGDGHFTVNGRFYGFGSPLMSVAADLDGDGAPERISTPSLVTQWVVILENRRLDPDWAWTDLGHGLAGSAGAPRLVGSGTLLVSSSGSLALSGAAPSKPALLFLSTTAAAVPFKGGLLLPMPALAIVPLATGPSGGLALTWPTFHAGLSGQTIVAQYAVADPGAIHGVALSNGVSGLVP